MSYLFVVAAAAVLLDADAVLTDVVELEPDPDPAVAVGVAPQAMDPAGMIGEGLAATSYKLRR